MNLSTLFESIRGPEVQKLADLADVQVQTVRAWAKGYISPQSGKRRRPTVDQIRLLSKDKRLTQRELMAEFYGSEQ